VKLGSLAILCLGCALAYADTATARHLTAGVQAFKNGRFDEALVELRVVERAADAPDDLAFYLGPTLVKLGRDREALGVLLRSRAARDALTDFYLGEAYYHLRLYRKAREVFAGLRSRGLGPALDEAATRYVRAVDEAYVAPISEDTVEYYATQAREETDGVLAVELWDEARLADDHAASHARRTEVVDALAAAWNAIDRPTRVIDVLATDPARSAESSWQLARAYVAVGDRGHAAPLLDGVVRGGGLHAAEAARVLASLHAR
jgi:hypothetical protein